MTPLIVSVFVALSLPMVVQAWVQSQRQLAVIRTQRAFRKRG